MRKHDVISTNRYYRPHPTLPATPLFHWICRIIGHRAGLGSVFRVQRSGLIASRFFSLIIWFYWVNINRPTNIWTFEPWTFEPNSLLRNGILCPIFYPIIWGNSRALNKEIYDFTCLFGKISISFGDGFGFPSPVSPHLWIYFLP